MDLRKRIVVVVAALIPFVCCAGVTVAHADTGPSDITSVTGNGTISPGIPTTGCTVSPAVRASGTLTFAPTSDDANLSGGTFTFDGTGSSCATLTEDSGSGTLGGVISGNVSYQRQGDEVQVSGTATLNGELHSTTWVCVWVWVNANPATAYEWICVATWDS